MNMGLIIEQTPLFIFFLSLLAAFFVFIKFQKSRILVETLEYVDKGFISKSGRYNIILDPKTKTKHLKPIFGKKTLYCPQNKYFKKVDGMAFIGINRHISFIKDGKDVKAVLPTNDINPNAEIHILDYRRWLFLKEREEFLRKIDKDKIVFLLSIYAPLIVVISTILFFAVTIMYQIGVLNNLSSEISKISDALINTIK